MTDTQHLFDYARRQFSEMANDVERHFEAVAGQLREWIPSTSSGHILGVIPTSAHRRPPPPPPTTLQAITLWTSRHKALTAGLTAFAITAIATAAYAPMITGPKRRRRRRRAHRASSGARTDVVILAGSTAGHPLTAALSAELERLGFVVFVVAATPTDVRVIRAAGRADVLPLALDITGVEDEGEEHLSEQVKRFAEEQIYGERRAFEGAEPHHRRLVGLIILPGSMATDSGSPRRLEYGSADTPAAIEDVDTATWSDALNAQILHPIALTRAFLPLVTSQHARILVLTPSVVTAALRPPLHAIETTVYGALEGFTASLHAEMAPRGIAVTQFKLGDIDLPAISARLRREGVLGPASSRWPATPMRQLHDAVFDALVASRTHRTWHVGRGSLTYDVIGAWVPAFATAWMMGWQGRGRSGSGRTTSEVPSPVVKDEGHEGELQGSQGSLTWEKVEQEG